MGRFATDSQGRKRMSGSDPRTGTFHQMRIAAGDNGCSVKGVSGTYMKRLFGVNRKFPGTGSRMSGDTK